MEYYLRSIPSTLNYPDPLNPSTTLSFDLPEASDVNLVVYDLLGREVKTLVSGMQQPGYKSVVWGGRDTAGRQLPSGIYIARLSTPTYTSSVKMILMK